MSLYTIIPPALIVLSVIGIIIFLMKKAPEVANIDEADSLKNNDEIRNSRKGGSLGSGTRWVKNISAKTQGLFFSALETIEKRKNVKHENSIISRSKNEEHDFPRVNAAVMPNTKKENEDNKVKPEKKDLFEKILIERIAANPKDIEAYERLGEYYMDIENWNYAKECFKQVIKLSPGSIKARMKMRKLERLLGK